MLSLSVAVAARGLRRYDVMLEQGIAAPQRAIGRCLELTIQLRHQGFDVPSAEPRVSEARKQRGPGAARPAYDRPGEGRRLGMCPIGDDSASLLDIVAKQ